MKSKYRSFLIASLFILSVMFSDSVFANSIGNSNKIAYTQDAPYTERPKSDSMPEGVTQDWLNSLKDDEGNKIVPEEDPEGDAFQSRVFNGLAADSRFGFAVSSAGDVNGDGFDDVIIGAYSYSLGRGRAYIYYGGLNLNTVADIIITGLGSSYNLGYSVSSAGDVNGDGYGDVIIAATGYSTNTGRAYIYFGGTTMNTGTFLTLTGEGAGNFFGTSVSSAGDVNGDGYSDVIVGASGYNTNTGRAYIFFGGASMNNVSDVTLTGAAASNYFGYSVSRAGDFNGDGYSDVIVGAFGYSTSTGRTYVYYGGTSMDNAADVTMTGAALNFSFGYSVAFAGDVNGDGYSDVISGATYYSGNTGRAYIYFGGSTPDNTEDVIITGESSGNYFGFSVSSAGDMNGDGYSDVTISAPNYNSNTGKVYIYFGGVFMNNVPDAFITGEGTNNFFGNSAACAGDMNGDGYSEVIAGSYGYNLNTGRSYLYDYYLKNEIVPDILLYAETEYSIYGSSVSSAGDVNGDGYSDVIVGAYNYNLGAGRAYIYFGGTVMDNIADVTMSGSANYSFGESVSAAGDVNGDGYSDVIVGANGYNSNTGRAYIYYGGAAMNNTTDVILTGSAINDYFGESVSDAGDVNGDGYGDVIVGARLSDAGDIDFGAAFIYFGGSSMNNTTDVTMTGEAYYDYFGKSVSDAGDVNNDGFSDVIVGAYSNDAGGSSAGRAYIYYGNAVTDNGPDVTLTGAAASDYLGYSVSDAGDVNGDGFSDVIVGAYGSDGGSTDAGRAYIYFGGIAMNNSPNVTLTGESAYDYFGNSVSSAGDINGDGFADAIASAHNNDNSGTSSGKSYIYFGGISMNNTIDVTMKGDSSGDTFGKEVSTAGDINSDGYADVIVGSPGNDVTGTNAGSSYIFTGSAISAKPIFNYVKDVPNDQGGKVNLKWSRSGYDVNGINKITDYYVEMSNPPSGGNFAWMPAATVPAVKNSFYSININTPYDSSSNSAGNFYFRITARTSNSSEYWRSGILSGRSIDNIAPLMVSPFTAAPLLSNVILNWKRSSSADLLNYIIYRNFNPAIDPETEPVFATTTDSTYPDTAPLIGTYYYFIVAQDIHNNKSPVAVAGNPGITLNLTMFIEGFFNSGSGTQVSDTITVELRNFVSPFTVTDQTKAVVAPDGSALIKFTNAPDGNYYFAVKHRNSIETWNAAPLAFSNSTPVSYNLSSSITQAYGSNLKQLISLVPKYAVYSGDENQNGIVDLSDVVNVSNEASSFTSGYVSSDMNGDNITDLSDLVLTSNNASAFVSKLTP